MSLKPIATFPYLATMLVVALGCSEASDPPMQPIRGTVTYNGESLGGGQVVYLPKTPGVGRQATGPIASDGTFVMTSRVRGDGVQHGEYDIVVFAFDQNASRGDELDRGNTQETAGPNPGGPASRIPAKYSLPGESGLGDKVDVNHSGTITIELTD